MGANLHLLLEQVLNGGAIQLALRGFGRGQPGVADGTGSAPVGALVVVGGGVDELVRHDRTFEGGHDVAKGQLARIASELVAAVRAANATNDAATA
jgi:hypothetical protein